jgi:hypothetical protein
MLLGLAAQVNATPADLPCYHHLATPAQWEAPGIAMHGGWAVAWPGAVLVVTAASLSGPTCPVRAPEVSGPVRTPAGADLSAKQGGPGPKTVAPRPFVREELGCYWAGVGGSLTSACDAGAREERHAATSVARPARGGAGVPREL